MKKKPPTKKEWANIKLVGTDVDGVLTDATVLYGPHGELAKPFFIRDGMGMRLLEAAGVHVCVITSEDSPLVAQRIQKLMLSSYKPGQKRKGAALQALMKEFSTSAAETVFIGDDVNDAEAMAIAGIAVSPADGSALARAAARHITKAPGGRGCIREVADLILAAKRIDPVKLWATLHPEPVSRDAGTV
jgi:YrbI family 3-deoxy-D-manno-octulosonate 8-phosphate phosphatase